MSGATERVTVAEAARLLGLTPQGVREHMKRKEIDIGSVVPCLQQSGRRKKYNYLIYRDKLNKFIGKEDGHGE